MQESTTIFQSIKDTEKILDVLERGQEEPWLNFHFSEPTSLFYSQIFSQFVEQLRKSLENFEHSSVTSHLTTIELELLRISKEEIDKQTFRRFFNELIKKFIKDDLAQQYPYLNELPFFSNTDSAELTSEDRAALEVWKERIVKDFDKVAKINQAARDNSKQVQPEKEEIEKKPDGSLVIKVGLGDGTYRETKIAPGQTAEYQHADGSISQVTAEGVATPTNLENQRLYFEEVSRESVIVEWQLIKGFAPELGLERLPPEIESYIRGQVGFELKNHISEYFQDGRMTALDRGKLMRAVLGNLQKNPFFQTQLFQYFDKVAQQTGQKTEYKTRQLTVDDVTRVATQTEEDDKQDLNQENYSKLAKEEFKKQLKEVLALSTLGTQDSIQSIAENILDFYPNLRGFDDLQDLRFELQQQRLLPSTMFEVNREGQDKILKEVGEYIFGQFKNRQLGAFSDSEKKTFEEGFRNILMAGAADPARVDSVLDSIFAEFEKTTNFSQINEDTLRKALPPDFLRLSSADQDRVRKTILEFFKTGKVIKISPENFDLLKQKALADAANPQENLRSVLVGYGIDGKDISSTQLLRLLDAYALNTANSNDLNKNIGVLLNQLNPHFADNPELVKFLQAYVDDRKTYFSNYTGNQLITYSDNQVDIRQLALAVADTNTLIAQYNADVVAHALFTKNLADLDAIQDEEERTKREQARQLREVLLYQMREQFNSMKQAEKDEYARLLEVDRQQFISENAQGKQVFDEKGYNDAIWRGVENNQPWNAAEFAGGDGPSRTERMTQWLDRLRSMGKLKGEALKKLSKQALSTAKSFGKKVAVPVLGIGAAAAGVGALIGALLKGLGTIVATGAGIAGGAAVGAALGSWVFGIGAIPGAIIGGIVGGVGSYITSSGSGAAAVQAASGVVQPAVSFAGQASQSAISAAAQTATLSGASIPTATIVGAVVGPIVVIGAFGAISLSAIFGAFLPDASVTQVAPYFNADINQSLYVTLTKVASPSNSPTPSQITYTIDIAKKPDRTETLILGQITDVMSAIDKDANTITPPTIPQDVIAQFAALNGTELGTTPIHIQFTVDASDARFQDSLVKNDITVHFTANGETQDTSNRAQTCFGDCPRTVVPPCWPVKGYITQTPFAVGGPVSTPPSSNSDKTTWCAANFNGASHCGSLGVYPDAYDIAVDAGTPIYAPAPGVVIFAGWNSAGFGYLLKIDHGGWISYYAHQPEDGIVVHVGDHVEGGDLIGHVDSSGNSSGNHLHYEVKGPSEYVLVQTLGVTQIGQSMDAPSCQEYYGR